MGVSSYVIDRDSLLEFVRVHVGFTNKFSGGRSDEGRQPDSHPKEETVNADSNIKSSVGQQGRLSEKRSRYLMPVGPPATMR